MPRRRRTARSPKSEPVRLALDLGGTKVVAALIAPTGRIVQRGPRVEHGNGGPEAVIAAVVGAARDLVGGDPLPRGPVGVSVAAQIDPTTGIVVHAPNLRWRNVPLGRKLERAFGRPVRLVNDAHAATFAEWTRGAGRGARDLVCLSLGTGVGGGVVEDGRLVLGATYAAGEVGHLTLVAGGRKCTCPNRGCLEAYVGGWGIEERAREAYALAEESGERFATVPASAHAVFDAVAGGDPIARAIVRETEQYLADGVVGIANAFNPARIVLGGGLVVGHPQCVRSVAEAVATRCQPSAASARVVVGVFGADAPLVGAGLWATPARAPSERPSVTLRTRAPRTSRTAAGRR